MAGRTRRSLLRSLPAAGVVALAGCADSENTSSDDGEGSESPEIGGRWVTATRTAASTVLPHRVVDEPSARRLELVMDGAYAITPERDLFPLWLDLAAVGDEQRVYEATLRDGLRWSDPYGRMTADDWVYYIRSIHQGEDNWAGSGLADAWADVGLERTGELTFEITLPEPNARFPFEPALRRTRCLPRGAIEPYVQNRDRDGLESDGTLTGLAYTGNLGPYTAESWENGGGFVATRNEGYYMRDREDLHRLWSSAPYFEAFEYRVVGRERDRLQALRDGTATATTIPPARLDQFRGSDDVSVYGVPQPTVTVLAYNQRANGWEPFRDPAVRRAVSMAIDKEQVAETVYAGFAEPIHTFQPPWSDRGGADLTAFGRQATDEDPMALLVNALGDEYGVVDGSIVGSDGEPVTLSLVSTDEAGMRSSLVALVVRELERAGLTIDTERVSTEELYSAYLPTEWTGEGDPPWEAGRYNAGPRGNTASATDWDLLCGLALNAYPRVPTATDRFWTERGDMNFAGYVPEAELTALYAEARAATNDGDRTDRLAEVFGALNEEQPANFLAARTTPVGYRAGIVGPSETLGHDWNRQTWYAE